MTAELCLGFCLDCVHINMDLPGLKTLVGTDPLLYEYNSGSRPDYSTQRLMKKLYGPKESGNSRKIEVVV